MGESNLIQAIALGIIQGLSEFLPISSSGHLVVLPWLFSFPDPGLAFDVALHAGTLLAVLLYFWRDWLNIFRLRDDRPEYRHSKMFLFLVFATIPGILAGALFEQQAQTIFRQPLLVSATLFAFGAFLYFADTFGKKSKQLEAISLRDALFIGASQALAIVPGVSRSGITITAALALGFDRISAARFSFLLSTPIIMGAMAMHTGDFRTVVSNPVFLAGVIASAISGYCAIKYLIRFVERASYRVFFWYRTALAFGIVIFFFSRI